MSETVAVNRTKLQVLLNRVESMLEEVRSLKEALKKK